MRINHNTEKFSPFDMLPRKDLMRSDIRAKIISDIVAKRTELGMSQAEFADHIKVGQNRISKWESGDFNFTLRELCELYDKLDARVEVVSIRYE